MHLLLIHQNFPGQFRDLAPAWLATGHQVTAIGSSSERPQGPQWQQLRFLRYRFEHDQDPSLAQRGHAVAQVCRLLQDEGSQPDVVIAHSAWGGSPGVTERLAKHAADRVAGALGQPPIPWLWL